MILMVITLLNPIRSASFPNAFCGNKILKIDRDKLMCTDPQQAFSTIPREFSYIYNACFLSKVLKLNYRNRKMWLTISNPFISPLELNMYYHLYKKSQIPFFHFRCITIVRLIVFIYSGVGYGASRLLVFTRALGAVKTVVLRASGNGLAVIHQPSYTVIITCQIHFPHYIIFDFVGWILAIYCIIEVLMNLFNQWVNWNVCPCQAFRIWVFLNFRIM